MAEAADPVQEQRGGVAHAGERGLSRRRACRLLGVARATARYVPHTEPEGPPVEALQRVEGQYPRFGVRRAHALLSAELRGEGQAVNHAVNHKRARRLWHKHGLQVPPRPKERRIKTGRSVPCQAQRPDHVWSCDFREDALLSGRKMRLLNILDEFTRQWLSVTVGVSLTSQAVIGALRVLFAARGVPASLRSDNGPESIAAGVQAWLRESGSAPHYIDPGCPWQNGFQGGFHGKLRDESLDREVFASVREVFASVREVFASVREVFASVREVFASVREVFASVREVFASVREAQARLETRRRWYNLVQ